MHLQETIINLRKLTELNIQSNWFFLDQNLDKAPLIIEKNWQKARVNDKNYLVWEKGNKIRWFAQQIIIPETLNYGYTLEDLTVRIALIWWAESAQIFINDKLVCEGDLFDSSSRILLTEKAQKNQKFIISLRLISPRHDIGGLMSSQCLYENNYNDIDPSFVANELTILDRYINKFYTEKQAFLEEETKILIGIIFITSHYLTKN